METPPILLDVPDELATERLVLRAPRYGDGEVVAAAIRDSLPELKPWMSWAQEPPLVDDIEANVRAGWLRFLDRSDLRFHVFERASGAFVGGSGLHRIDWAVPKFEIGYWVATSMGGRGYVTEAADALARLAADTLGAHRIEIRCDARNERSQRVAKRLGFTREGVLRGEKLDVTGRPCDTVIFAKVRGHELPAR